MDSVASAPAPRQSLSQFWRQSVTAGRMVEDSGQDAVIAQLDGLKRRLEKDARRPLAHLFRRLTQTGVIRGLYIHGPVGRGKSMLMDLFFQHLNHPLKRRWHFHEFMQLVHSRFKAHQDCQKTPDALRAAADGVARECRVLCLDEFQVSDIADAMILSRLFSRLFARATVLVATSNTAAEDLYRDGLQRRAFLPFIPVLTRYTDMTALDSAVDYRRLDLEGHEMWFVSSEGDNRVHTAFDALFARLCGQAAVVPAVLELGPSRQLTIPFSARGMARISFAALCAESHSARDYHELARHFDILFLERIPRLDEKQRDALKRLITLVDILYDRRKLLIADAMTEIDDLYTGQSHGQAFQRLASRLHEMQKPEYYRKPMEKR